MYWQSLEIKARPGSPAAGFSSESQVATGKAIEMESMTTEPVRTQPNAAAEMKLRRAREAAQAVKDYEANAIAVRARTERLRAERLAREAANPSTKKASRRAGLKSRSNSA